MADLVLLHGFASSMCSMDILNMLSFLFLTFFMHLLYFVTESPYVAQSILELAIALHQPF